MPMEIIKTLAELFVALFDERRRHKEETFIPKIIRRFQAHSLKNSQTYTIVLLTNSEKCLKIEHGSFH